MKNSKNNLKMSVASVVASIGTDAGIMLGDHDHDASSVLQNEDDEMIREIASHSNIHLFPITGSPKDLNSLLRSILNISN